MTRKKTSLLFAITLTGLSISTAFAARPDAGTAAAKTQAASAELTPAQRGQLTKLFVQKWGYYVQQTQGVKVRDWTSRLVPTLLAADSDNFRNALKRNTFEGAMNTLSGSGHRRTDEDVITELATMKTAGPINMKLGQLGSDLVYTPLTPCRIFDTRLIGGAITGAGTRSFHTFPFGATNFTYQGGSFDGDCGMEANAAAVIINLTAVNPSSVGFATMYPFGTTRPLAASVTYNAGDLLNNSVIAKSANGLFDVTIYSSATSHYVGDVVGYFAAPVATALQCVEVVSPTRTIVAGGNGFATTPACPITHEITSGGCGSSTFFGRLVTNRIIGQTYFCSAVNEGASSLDLAAYARCCRVPGR